MKIFLWIIVALLVSFAVFSGIVYLFRYDVFQYSAESLIMKNLPEYVRLDGVVFDLKTRTLVLKGFRVLNPEGYAEKYFCQVERFICRYELKGRKLFDGIEVTEMTAEKPVLYIERKSDGRINSNEMQGVVNRSPGGAGLVFISDNKTIIRESAVKGPYADEVMAKKTVTEGNFITKKLSGALSSFNLFDFLEVTDTLGIKDGEFIFVDGMVSDGYKISLKDIDGNLRVVTDSSYRKIISVESVGTALVNGYVDQQVEWVTSFDPGASAITMANKLKFREVDVRQFKPYFDRYLPIDVLAGRGTGEFIINFDNGNIGSTDTVTIRDLRYRDKTDDSSAVYWQGAFAEVLRYLTSSTGEVIFDFKIKGPMENPVFYPGPHVKKAVQSMVVDKIAEAVESFNKKASKETPEAVPAGVDGQKKTDVQKVVDIINVLLEDK